MIRQDQDLDDPVDTGGWWAIGKKLKSFIDEKFPLFMVTFQQAKIPIILEYPFMFFYFVQVIIVSLWPWSFYWSHWQDNSVMKWSRTIFFFIPYPATNVGYFSESVVFFGLNLLSLFFVRFQLIYFKFRRKFVRFLLYPIRFYYDTILVASYVPVLIASGETFYLIAKGNKDTLIIIAFVLFIISLIYETYSFATVQNFASKSVCVNPSPLLNYDPSIMIRVLWIMLSLYSSFFVLLLFENWAQLFAIILHFFLYIHCLVYMFRHMPFVDSMTQGMAIGWMISCTISDLLMVIGFFVPSMPPKVPLIISLVTFIFFGVVSIGILILRGNTIAKIMLENRRDQDFADEYYTNLGLENNETFALLCLRTAFIHYCPCFYNMTLINYIIERYDSELALCTCLQLVSYFPKEVKLKNRIMKILSLKRSLSYVTRFLMYQVGVLTTLRQYTETEETKLKHIELKTLSRQVETIARYAIDNPKLNPNYFEYLAEKASKVRSIWKETLDNSPNNPRTCDEFARYLIECECDFPEGIKLKNRQQIIELGYDFTIDYSFRSMIEGFPGYLTRKIVDFHGKIIANEEQRVEHEENNQQPVRRRVTMENNADREQQERKNRMIKKLDEVGLQEDEELESEVEEYIGKKTMVLAKARLALHRCLENKIPAHIRLMKLVWLCITVFVLLIYILGISLSSYYLHKRVDKMKQLDSMSNSRFYSALANINILMQYFNTTGKLQRYTDIMKTYLQPKDVGILDPYQDMLTANLNFTTIAAASFQDMMNIFAELAQQGNDVYSFAYSLIKPVIKMNICDEQGNVTDLINTSYGSLASTMLVNQRYLISFERLTLADACEITSNYEPLYHSSAYLFANVSLFQKQGDGKLIQIFTYVYYIVPVIIFLIVFVPFVVIHFMSRHKINQIIEMIYSFDSNAKQFAKGFITINNGEEETAITESHSHRKFGLFLIGLICVISIFFFFLTFISARIILNSINDIQNLNVWNKYSSKRLSLSTECFNIFMLIIVKHDVPNSYNLSTIQNLISTLNTLLADFQQSDNDLIDGTSDSPACFGYDPLLDQYNVFNDETIDNITSPRDYYAHASIHTEIDILKNYINGVIIRAANSDSELPADEVANIIYLANYHLWGKLILSNQRVTDLGYDGFVHTERTYLILIFILIILTLLFLLVIYFYYLNRLKTFNAILFVVKRFSPYALLGNKLFNKIFLKSSQEEADDTQSLEYCIIKNSKNAIFCTNTLGIVEQANVGVGLLLGYTPEQVLGQLVQTMFVAEDMQTLAEKMEAMKSGQSSCYIEEDMTAVSDNAAQVAVHVTLIGMKKEYESNVNSFVVILNNISELLKQKQQAEEAKQKSEKLLYQILPRDIVLKLNKGEKDISFDVASATVVFIDINKFSEYAANLTSQEIMSNLSTYFAAIDKIAAKYCMVQKIKLIGDIYMAAAGLFNPDSPPEQHAEQTIRFALDCIKELENINETLNSNLQIRIGINSGGPIIAGVLGTDKPVFDIISDTINVAARLQSTCEVNKVHISQATLGLINNFNYEVTQRGETFLKGKGKQLTYYINYSTQNVSAIGTNSSIDVRASCANLDYNARSSFNNLEIFTRIAQSKSLTGNLLLLDHGGMRNASTTSLLTKTAPLSIETQSNKDLNFGLGGLGSLAESPMEDAESLHAENLKNSGRQAIIEQAMSARLEPEILERRSSIKEISVHSTPQPTKFDIQPKSPSRPPPLPFKPHKSPEPPKPETPPLLPLIEESVNEPPKQETTAPQPQQQITTQLPIPQQEQKPIVSPTISQPESVSVSPMNSPSPSTDVSPQISQPSSLNVSPQVSQSQSNVVSPNNSQPPSTTTSPQISQTQSANISPKTSQTPSTVVSPKTSPPQSEKVSPTASANQSSRPSAKPQQQQPVPPKLNFAKPEPTKQARIAPSGRKSSTQSLKPQMNTTPRKQESAPQQQPKAPPMNTTPRKQDPAQQQIKAKQNVVPADNINSTRSNSSTVSKGSQKSSGSHHHHHHHHHHKHRSKRGDESAASEAEQN